MPELKSRDALKPFCPIHHWRMAHYSTTGSQAGSSAEVFYRCSSENCTQRYSVVAGYYDSNNLPGDGFQSHLEIVTCKQNREHYPCIVSYAKESVGSQTEEWRQWRCFADNCSFSVTQKLSQQESKRLQSAGFTAKSSPAAQHQHAFARR